VKNSFKVIFLKSTSSKGLNKYVYDLVPKEIAEKAVANKKIKMGSGKMESTTFLFL
jgi:hypothetical protein